MTFRLQLTAKWTPPQSLTHHSTPSEDAGLALRLEHPVGGAEERGRIHVSVRNLVRLFEKADRRIKNSGRNRDQIAGLGGQNGRQFESGSHEICM